MKVKEILNTIPMLNGMIINGKSMLYESQIVNLLKMSEEENKQAQENIRATAAIVAMQAILNDKLHCELTYENVAETAVKYADALMNELNK